jgi:predicted nucleic acid-binding protein
MIAYVDTSALLRLILREAGALDEIRRAEGLVSSELVVVESSRTLDRLRLANRLTMREAARAAGAVGEWLEAFDLVLLKPAVLSRAGQPLPLPLGTLDAVHLVSALIWQERRNRPLVMATHDDALAGAAQAFGMHVIGA